MSCSLISFFNLNFLISFPPHLELSTFNMIIRYISTIFPSKKKSVASCLTPEHRLIQLQNTLLFSTGYLTGNSFAHFMFHFMFSTFVQRLLRTL